MTTSISRQEARERIADATVARLTPGERAAMLEEWWSLDPHDEGWEGLPDDLRAELVSGKDAPSDAMPAKYDPLLRLAAMQQTLGARNAWLQAKLSALGIGSVEVTGDPEPMLECSCCGYLTLRERGGYEICPVCFWEDDGSAQPDRASAPNHMTLAEGRRNFARLGACSEDSLRHVVANARAMYGRGGGDPP